MQKIKLSAKPFPAIILTEDDLLIPNASFDALPIEMLTYRDFKLSNEDYRQASTVLYVAPNGMVKVIKIRTKVIH